MMISCRVPMYGSCVYLSGVYGVHISLISDFLFLNDGKGSYLSLRKCCYLGLNVGFLAKCCLEDSPLGKQKTHCKLESLPQRLYPHKLWLLFCFLTQMPTVSKERLSFCGLGENVRRRLNS